MWLHMHLNGFIRFKCSNMVSFGFLQLHIVDQSCMWSHTVSNGSIWLHAIYVLVIIFLLWFYAAQYGFIRLYIVKYGLIWSLRLHSLDYKCMWLQMVADGSCYICTYYMFLYCICIWINMVAYCFTLLNVVANSQQLMLMIIYFHAELGGVVTFRMNI